MSKKRRHITDEEALLFHSKGKPGKLEINATKPMATQHDLSLAYSPGVAVPVRAIAEDPDAAYEYTTKGNMVAVRSEEHTSELKSIMRNSYAVFCLNKQHQREEKH